MIFQPFKLNQAKAPSADSLGKGYLRWIKWIHRSHTLEGVNSSSMVVMFAG